MADIGAWLQSGEFLVLVGFHVFILAMLALDLGWLQRTAHAISMKEATAWSILWVALAMLFALGIWQFWHVWNPQQADLGGQKAVEFVTGYLVEKSLSVDNLFVLLVIFRYFGVPASLQHRVLLWGILGAIVMRAALILIGAAVLGMFHWAIYLFGAFLLYTAFKMFHSVEENIDPSRNWLLRLARRFLPVIDSYESQRFWVKRGGHWYATPLPLVLLVVETTDVLFATDSIPAIFAITKDPFIIYTSNIFAILGLRALYFLLANFLGMFRYLKTGLALVLAFVGLKMIVEESCAGLLADWGIEKSTLLFSSLGVIAAILGVSVAASIWAGPREPLDTVPEATSEVEPAASPDQPA